MENHMYLPLGCHLGIVWFSIINPGPYYINFISFYTIILSAHVVIVINKFLDINECEANSNNCHSDAKCINNNGSFICQCKPGYDGDGVTKCQCKLYIYIYIY